MKRKSFRRVYCLILTLLFLFGASFFANAGNGVALGGTTYGYMTIGWNLTGGISHIHYSFSNSSGYTAASGLNYQPRVLFACSSWDTGLSGSLFTFTTTTAASRDIRFEFVYDQATMLHAWCEYYVGNTRVSTDTATDSAPLPYQDYDYVVIKCNQAYLSSDFITRLQGQASYYGTSNTSENYGLRALFTHEVGHALGLAHFTCDMSPIIMDEPAFQVYARDGIYTPQWPDIDGVEAIY